MSREDFLRWKTDPCTIAVIGYIDERITDSIQEMINKDPSLDGMSLDQYGMFMSNMRFFIDGLSQISDIQSLIDYLAPEEEHDRA